MKVYTTLLFALFLLSGCFLTPNQQVPVQQPADIDNSTDGNTNAVEKDSILDFEDCVRSGFPVMESYPRQCRDDEGNIFVENIGTTLEKQDMIRVTSLQPNQEIVGELVIEGEARGSWFFEAEFPITLRDLSGNQLAATIAVAQAEWMTEDFVPFKATMEVYPGDNSRGILYLHKSNPTGDSKYDDTLELPVTFPEEYTTVEVHFVDSTLSENSLFCDHTAAVSRSTDKTQSVARFALEQLFKGPSDFEKIRGYTTSINPGVTILSLQVENGTALVDLSDEVDQGVAGSCWVGSIRAQIEATLKQFPTIQEVVISVEGDSDEALQP